MKTYRTFGPLGLVILLFGLIAGLLTVFLGIIADQVTELRKERFEDHRD